MKKGCTKVITSLLADCSPSTLEHVLFFCIMTMLEEYQNGNSTYGFKIFLQLMIRGSPDIVMSKLPQVCNSGTNIFSKTSTQNVWEVLTKLLSYLIMLGNKTFLAKLFLRPKSSALELM